MVIVDKSFYASKKDAYVHFFGGFFSLDFEILINMTCKK